MYISGKKCPSAGMKLAPPIQNASIVRCEKRADQKIWFIVRVVPQQGIMSNTKRPVSRQPYFVARRHEDFVAFNQRLHEAFPTSARSLSSLASRAGSRAPADTIALPKLNGKRLNLLQNKKQVHVQRRADIDKFISSLFTMPPSISQSLVVLEFFGLQDTDAEIQPSAQQQRLLRSQSSITQDGFFDGSQSLRKSASHPDLITTNEVPEMPALPSAIPNGFHPLDPLPTQIAEKQQQQPSPLWKRFKTRGRSHATPASHATPLPQPTISSSSLSNFCSQAASKIMPWASRGNSHHQQLQQCMPPAPSYSTPAYPPMVPPKSCCRYQHRYPQARAAPASVITSSSVISSTSSSSHSSRDSQSTCATSIAPNPTTSPTLRTIKIKVIYDVDNIIVIQVPRSVTLSDLRARIAQKFCDPAIALPHDFVLLFNDTRSSASSNTSAASSLSIDSSSGTATVIAKESDLAKAMGTMWVRLEKVTLRCIA